jgi:hypothetical protein
LIIGLFCWFHVEGKEEIETISNGQTQQTSETKADQISHTKTSTFFFDEKRERERGIE